MRLAHLPAWDPRRRVYKERASAHKWLLVTCFGYLGYKNARFGRIEAHEAVTAYGREALLQAKEAAEDLGGTVLHLYVDGLWVKQPGAPTVNDFQPLLDEIATAPACRLPWTASTAGWLSCPPGWTSACRWPTAISASSRTAR
jgi:DNA polymerase elongation subunit (family B)